MKGIKSLREAALGELKKKWSLASSKLLDKTKV
jgi:hypothetical protein